MGYGVMGVDFSGAQAAGDALWVTEATQTGDGLRIDDCYRGTDRWGRDRETAHAALADRITDDDIEVVGLDFPFSLPQSLLTECCDGTWRGLLEWLGGSEGPTDPETFSTTCRQTAERLVGDRDVRRETDLQRGGLCPYTNRTRAMTFYGVRDVLGRVADAPGVAVTPMQAPADDETTRVCEVYPAATFSWLGCYREGYKKGDGARERKQWNLETVEACSVELDGQWETYLESHDALDSLAAAVSAGRVGNGSRPTLAGTTAEGHIYI